MTTKTWFEELSGVSIRHPEISITPHLLGANVHQNTPPDDGAKTLIRERGPNRGLLAQVTSMAMFLSCYEGDVPAEASVQITATSGAIYLPMADTEDGDDTNRALVEMFAEVHDTKVLTEPSMGLERVSATSGRLTMFTVSQFRGGER